jgi:hypothetical protein
LLSCRRNQSSLGKARAAFDELTTSEIGPGRSPNSIAWAETDDMNNIAARAVKAFSITM